MGALKIYKLDDRIDFGKHIGKLILNLVDEDLQYLIWAHKEVKVFKLDPSIYQGLVKDKEAEEKTRYDREEEDEWLNPDTDKPF